MQYSTSLVEHSCSVIKPANELVYTIIFYFKLKTKQIPWPTRLYSVFSLINKYKIIHWLIDSFFSFTYNQKFGITVTIKIIMHLISGNNTQPQVYSNNLGGPAPPGYYSGNQTGQPQPGYYDNQSGPQQPGFHNAQPGTQTGFNNYGPFAHTQGYESSNPTGKIEPAYPPPYSTVSVQPYTGSGVPPPFPYQDPVSPGMQGNPVMMDNSMSNAGNAQ